MTSADMESEDDVALALAPAAGPMLERARVGWLEPVRARLVKMQALGLLPHGFLISGSPGAGQAEIATWLGARLLCRATEGRPCGSCADCRLILAGSHPDFRWVGVLPDKKEISIDQLRALSETLSMRSYRGGAKVAVISPAEVMSTKAHNALLKTLEEPAPETYLVLATSRIDRIPKTILSRSARLELPLPEEDAALAWLRQQDRDVDWPALLALARGAPFLAIEHERAGLGALDAEMRDVIAAAGEGRLDFVAFAAYSAKNAPAARLDWLENWLTRSLKDDALASDLVNNNRLPWLRAPGRETKIRAGFGLLDRLREARRDIGGPLNMQLVFEGLAVSLAALVGRPREASRGRAD
jgi:DNA polymerase-3 subunit delta'